MQNLLLWLVFGIIIAGILALDLSCCRRQQGTFSFKQAFIWSTIWISLAFLFNIIIYVYFKLTMPAIAAEKALEFFTGYVLEKSLSVDNIFVFLLIFSAFNIPPLYQRRVLVYGVMGAMILRALMIGLGSALMQRFDFLFYLFGAFLIFTGVKMFFSHDQPMMADHPLIGLMKKHLRFTDHLAGDKFSLIQNGKRYFTPLLLVLVLIELSDLVFATDSIPAIFAITTDPFIIFTSNIFAILGLRALYFLLAGFIDQFSYLKPALALILFFVGVKMLIHAWWVIPTSITLIFILAILSIVILFGKKDGH